MSTQGKKIHEGNGQNRDYIAMTMPLLLMGFFYNGPRVLALALIAVVTARLADRLAAVLRGRRYDATENSSVTIALVLVLLLPVTARVSVVVAAVLVAVLVGKEAFGGYKSYPFNPSAVGFCVAAVSWPQEVLRYPQPLNWLFNFPQNAQQWLRLWTFEGVVRSEGPTMTLRLGGLPKIDFWSLLLGDFPGAMGVTCNLVILATVVYLIAKKRFNLFASGAFLVTIALFAFIFPRYAEIGWRTWPQDIMLRLQVVKFELLATSLVFVAVFMVNDPGTLPRNRISQLIYGLLLGVATMLFSYYGPFEMGVCFAFLLVNAVSGYFDRAISAFSARRKGAAAELQQTQTNG